MKYIVIDTRKNDEFTKEFEKADEAVAWAEYEWDRMTEHDKKDCAAYYVLESVNPDEDAEDHFDGNPIKTFK